MSRTNLLAFVLLIVVLPSPGCRPPPPATNVSPQAADFQQLLDTSVAELKAKNEAHQAWGLGSFDRWDIDQEDGHLVFTSDDGATATAPAQIIGSFSTKDNSWLWAWDNPSILDPLKTHSLKVKAYGEEHGIEKLTTRKWTGSEEDAWAMTALAVKLCDAQGAYRGPSGSSYVFMTFGEVQLSKAD
jgi:hypothetical protein